MGTAETSDQRFGVKPEPPRITPERRRSILVWLQRGESPEKISGRVEGVTPYLVRVVIGDLAAEELQRPTIQD